MVTQSLSLLAVFTSVVLAGVLEVASLPDFLAKVRPEWMVLSLIYWLIRYPERIGVVTALVLGLVMDVISGSYLGVNMLSMSLICYLVLSMQQRLKMFPIVQQACVVFFVTGIQLMVVYSLKVQLSVADSGLTYLWQALASAIVWPFVVLLYDRLAHGLR